MRNRLNPPIRPSALGVVALFAAAAGCAGPTAPPWPAAVAEMLPGDSAAAYRGATRPAAGAPSSPDPRVPGVANFGVASPDVWRGARPTAEGMRSLAALGVRTIIDLQEDDRSALVPPGVRYVPLRTSGWYADRVDTAAVLRAIADNPKPVFVHCLEGRDLTGLAIGAYQLSRGADIDAALTELDRFGVHFWWRGPVAAQLRRLEKAAKSRPTSARSEPATRSSAAQDFSPPP